MQVGWSKPVGGQPGAYGSHDGGHTCWTELDQDPFLGLGKRPAVHDSRQHSTVKVSFGNVGGIGGTQSLNVRTYDTHHDAT